MEFTGKEGSAMVGSTVLEITGWSASPVASEHRTDDTGTAGYSDRVTGIRDCKFTIEINIDLATNLFDTPAIVPGATLSSVKLFYQGTTGAHFDFPSAKVLETPVTSKVDDLTKMTITCANKGAFTMPTGTAVANVP